MLSEISLEHNGTKLLKRIGPGFWGNIYVPEKEPFCYRLIPIEGVGSIETREEIKQLMGKPRHRGIAPVKDVFQAEISGSNVLVIQYEIITPTFWTNIIAKEDARNNLLYFTEILKILPYWWSQVGQCIIPMPSDIVFSDGTPFILQMPSGHIPPVNHLLEGNDRLEFLAPEFFNVIKGKHSINGKNLDIYALGVGLYKSLYKKSGEINDSDYRSLYFGKTYNEVNISTKKIPAWCEKVVQVQSMYNTINQLIARDLKFRSFYEPEKLSNIITENIKYFDPAVVISQLLKEGKTEMAYGIVKDILITDRSYAILVLAADIASKLNLVLEAVEYLEEIINNFKNLPDKTVYAWQLELLVKNIPEYVIQLVLKQKDNLLEKTEVMIDRDYSQLPFAKQDEFVEGVVSLLLLRGKYEQAAIILHPHLYDANNTYLWWKFQRTIAYTACLAGQGRIDDSKMLIADIREKLKKVEAEGRLHPEIVIQHKKKILEIEKQIVGAK